VQTRPLIVAVVVLTLLVGYVWWSSRRDEDEGPVLEEGEVALLDGVDTAQVVGLRLGIPGKSVELVRQGEADWLVAGEPDRPADDALAEAAARAAAGITSTRQLGTETGALADYGLEDDAFGLVVETADGATRSLRLGDRTPVGGARYLLDVDAGALHLVDGWSLSALERDPMDFRDRRLLPLDPDLVTRIEVAREGRVALVLDRPGRHWFLDTEPAWRADTRLVRDLLLDLVEIRARDYLDPPAPGDDDSADPGSAPALEVRLRASDGGEAVLSLTARRPDGLREAVTGGTLLPDPSGERARTSTPFLDELDTDPVVWRTFELLDFNPWVVETIEHSAGGRTWRLEKRAGDWVRVEAEQEVPLDAEKVQALLADLDDLRAVAYAPSDLEPGEAGVQQARVELVQSDEERVALELYRGANRDYVQIDGEPGLKEVDADVHALIGHLRPLQPDDPADEPAP